MSSLKKSRESCTSITHLVKEVARETIAAHLDEIAKEVHKRIFPPPKDMRSRTWSGEEEQSLINSFETFCAVQAKHHGRTKLAIQARIKQLYNHLI
jgi:hypothetical protein